MHECMDDVWTYRIVCMYVTRYVMIVNACMYVWMYGWYMELLYCMYVTGYVMIVNACMYAWMYGWYLRWAYCMYVCYLVCDGS